MPISATGLGIVLGVSKFQMNKNSKNLATETEVENVFSSSSSVFGTRVACVNRF